MSLIRKYIYEYDNEYLNYLYHYDKEIMVSKHIRGCLLLTVDNIQYAIPFRSNMKHKNGVLIPIGKKNFGLDFSKAIPIIDFNLLQKIEFKLTKKEEDYYNNIDNFVMVMFKFEQYLKKIYYENKKHNTHHKILMYAQKFKYIEQMKNINIYNEKQEQITFFIDIIDFQTLYQVIDNIYDQKIKEPQLIKKLLEQNNTNIFIYIN